MSKRKHTYPGTNIEEGTRVRLVIEGQLLYDPPCCNKSPRRGQWSIDELWFLDGRLDRSGERIEVVE